MTTNCNARELDSQPVFMSNPSTGDILCYITGNWINIPTGSGLDVSGSTLTIAVGNGLTFDLNNKLTCDAASLAGNGLSANGSGSLTVKCGSGLDCNGADLTIAIGNGLTFDGYNKLSVDAVALAGNGLTDNGTGNLTINCGSGLDCSGADLTIAIGNGLKFDINNRLAADPISLAGNGLIADDSGALAISPIDNVPHAMTGDQELRDTVNALIDALIAGNLMMDP